MARLEDLTVGTRVSGVVPNAVVTVKSVAWSGNQAIEVIFEDIGGRLDRKLLFRNDEHQLEVVTAGRPWSFEADSDLFRLVSEAHRIRLAWLFDPYVAITTSPVDPGAEVDVKLEIHIRVPGGIDDRSIRTISANAATLKLLTSNFERD